MKRVLLTITALFWNPLLYAETELNITPRHQYVIVFDLHGVVLDTDWNSIWQEFKKFTFSLHTISTFFNPFLLYDTVRLYHVSDSAEEVITKLIAQYPKLKTYYPTFMALVNAQKPNNGTVQILNRLKSDGYPLYVFSNIGPESLRFLQEKFPSIFNSFAGFIHSQPEDNWIQKPNTRAYTKLLKQYNLHPEQIIFIDDKQVNINAAHKMGFNTILFVSPEQLQKSLNNFIGQSVSSALPYV